ncbi:MAG: CDGSH iron-sulfur domain-containing protein [Candidatus Latescibacterota bacterium]|nr:CDGSH iron-sulfur domain-containing protein [Candidatus Latescibacterota bacterium]
MAEDKPTIDVMESAPFIVKGLKNLYDADGNNIEMEKDVIALCRCGGSQNKPFCDGAHRGNGFKGDNEGGKGHELRESEGEEVTVVDDRNLCCFASACSAGAPSVFFKREDGQRFATPDASSAQEVIDAIRKCPSGSLLYKLKGELQDQYFSTAEIQILKDGPIAVRGGIVLNNPDGGQPKTTSHYTLCRCGHSTNKPFCDGAHSDAGFSDAS